MIQAVVFSDAEADLLSGVNDIGVVVIWPRR
jgi:hypothetical protein